MKKMSFFLFAVCALLVTTTVGASGPETPLRIGWVIGDTEAGSVSILHTRNGGLKWTEQLDRSEWAGYTGLDISAVDRLTAWAALGPLEDKPGVILHTTNGGATWTAQKLPDGVDGIKNIKGLSRNEAWAVSLGVKILHTTDGGETWNIVEHPFELIDTVNRMDAIGCVDPRNAVRPGKDKLMSNANIWIAYELDNEDNFGMIHSLYNGELWRKEFVPHPDTGSGYNGLHMVSAYSPRVVWAAASWNSSLFRTIDGGESWGEVADVKGGPNDIDDMCAPSSDTVWAVQYFDTSSGAIYHVRLVENGTPEVLKFGLRSGYTYGGVTCVDDQTALVVGSSGEPSLPKGLIVSTTDGGQHWTRHSGPFSDVDLWKTSFVGARR